METGVPLLGVKEERARPLIDISTRSYHEFKSITGGASEVRSDDRILLGVKIYEIGQRLCHGWGSAS